MYPLLNVFNSRPCHIFCFPSLSLSGLHFSVFFLLQICRYWKDCLNYPRIGNVLTANLSMYLSGSEWSYPDLMSVINKVNRYKLVHKMWMSFAFFSFPRFIIIIITIHSMHSTLYNNLLCRAPRWASVNLGIFICMQCSGIHRSLGVHISKVMLCSFCSWYVMYIILWNIKSVGDSRITILYGHLWI